MILGIDYAKRSGAGSPGKKTQVIKDGRGGIRQGLGCHVQMPDDKFDLVTAVETQYYWPDLVKDMREILRALKPGGTLIIIAESYKDGRFDLLKGPVMKLLRSARLSADEHRELFSTAGYTGVQ